MITEYINQAMAQATYELLDDGTFYGEIPVCQGVWSQADSLDACRANLQNALEGWLILGIRLGHQLPIIEGVELNLIPEAV